MKSDRAIRRFLQIAALEQTLELTETSIRDVQREIDDATDRLSELRKTKSALLKEMRDAAKDEGQLPLFDDVGTALEQFPLMQALEARWRFPMLLLFILALLVGHPALPNHDLTPGVVNPKVTKEVACTTKWGADRRAVTEKMKVQVAAAYGLKRAKVVAYPGKGVCCEFDHLISRELGGADDVANLWPQPWTQAKQKDRLENRLHVLVCNGTISLETAQHAIAEDWVKAYGQYVK